MTMTRQF